MGGNHFRFHLHYGWYILAASFAILFFNSGARYSFGVMFKPMIAEFGWNRGSISFAFFLSRTLSGRTFQIVPKKEGGPSGPVETREKEG